MQLDVPIDIDPPVQYVIVSQHRNSGYINKSRWKVPMPEEVGCFVQSRNNKWLLGDSGWGVIIDGVNNLKILGFNNLREELKVAKFIANDDLNLWHGYPADIKRKIKDVPPVIILENWCQRKIIKKYHMSRIRRQSSCSL